MKRAPRSRQRHDLYAKYHDYDSEISDLLGECGFNKASSLIYGRPPAELNNTEFTRLVAVLISPSSYKLAENDTALNERVSRIERLVAGKCAPEGHSDVWLEGCRQPSNS